MSLLNIALTGLNASQKQLEVIGNNISNANTAGYSRQEVILNSSQSQFMGVGYIGSGVDVTTIRRLHDSFVTEQMRADTQLFKGFETYRDNIDQINRLLGDERTGIGPVLSDFFSALQTASDSPGFIPAREAFIGAASVLQDRFNLIYERMDQQSNLINDQLRSYSGEVNTLATGIAQLNEDIQNARGDSRRAPPNDLLDKRDEMVRQLSEIVSVDVVVADGNYDVYIGSGQALVIGFEANRLETQPGIKDPSRSDIMFVSKKERLAITDSITGGQLGGTLKFRNENLDEALNYLGRVAIGVATAFNEQQARGINLFGAFGSDMFTDYNDQALARSRVQYSANNARPNDRVVEVYIRDIGELSVSDYEMRFTGPRDSNYEVVRLTDGEVVSSGVISGERPASVSFDGIEVKLVSGTFQEGDRYVFQPTRGAAKDFDLKLTLPAELAFAMPITGGSSLANQGTGAIDNGVLLDANTSSFAVPGELSPPILVVFESADRYTLLDNSDPLRPRQLQPPMRNLPFTPGIANDIFSNNPGETQVTSYSGWLPKVPFTQAANQPDSWPSNGFNPERITFQTLGPDGKPQLLEHVSTPGGASAKQVASELNGVPGVTARAFTEVELSNFRDATPPYDPPVPFEVYINGVDITMPGEDIGDIQGIFEEGFIKEVPSPLTADFIASRINSSFELQDLGISAKSDGFSVKITSADGDDIRIEMKGDRPQDVANARGDSFEVSNGQQVFLDSVGADTRGLLTQSQGFDFSERGPYLYEFTTPYGDKASIELTDNYADADDMLLGIAQKIEAELASQERIKRNDPWLNGADAPGRVDVSIDERGNISFKVVMKMEGQGNADSQKMTMGGQVDVVMDDGITMTTEPPYGNLFTGTPDALPTYTGYQFQIDGRPVAGDRFEIGYNKDPSADNRNSERMIDLQTAKLLNGRDGGLNFNDAYSQLIQQIGLSTRQAQINTETARVSLDQTESAWQQVSGVNLDEEAARLVRFEQAYNANAQMIRVAQEIFNSLLGAFR
ncbi:MAG: flagellar hook-associated protein FlgK [Natronospirillum sp.]